LVTALDKSPGHPFDEPYTMLRSLKLEINDIRAAVYAEQQERAFEIKQMGQDLAEIHRQIAQGQVDLADSGKAWKSALQSEVVRIDATSRDMQDRLSQGTAHVKKVLANEIEALRTGQAKLQKSLHSMHDGQEKALRDLAGRIDANAHGDNEFAKDIRKDLLDHTEKLKLIRAELGEHSGSLTHCSMSADALLDTVQKVQERVEHDNQYLKSHLAEELQRIDQVIEGHRIATASAIQSHWKTMTNDFREVRARVEGLKNNLDGERRERVQTAELLGSRVDDTLRECSRWTVVSDRTKSLYSHKGLGPRS